MAVPASHNISRLNGDGENCMMKNRESSRACLLVSLAGRKWGEHFRSGVFRLFTHYGESKVPYCQGLYSFSRPSIAYHANQF